ncbi:MAG: LD-carboxypeptidase [Anaerorhabdus sp.]|uniref:S66 family peptidase n=1 Tax=Anaerorhabdus sp. TaxID=1872524 RepID=UPI002FC8D7C1
MIYPKFIQDKSTIGVVAPSFGVAGEPYYDNYIIAKESLQEMGFRLVECPSIYNLEKGQSNLPKIRAKELMDFYEDDSIDFLWSCAGGEIMNEILPYLDFERIKQLKPKWFIGYSDNTCFIQPLATKSNIASLYGMCISEFNSLQIKEASQALINLLMGKQHLFYQFLDQSTQTITNENTMIEGRLLGGCVEVIMNLLQTQYDGTLAFIEQYEGDVILYLEAYELNSLGMKRTLWQLRELGYLNKIKGILIGKLRNDEPAFDVTITEALLDLKLDIPVIYDVEFGHTYPTIPMVNGAYAKVSVINQRFSIDYDFTR